MKKFAVIADWPEVKNAEYEIIKRLQIAASNIGSECIVVDNQGYEIQLLAHGFRRKNRLISNKEVSFCINLHFINPKLFDIYTYVAMWNPPKFLFDWGYKEVSRNLLTFDDYLIYGSQPINNHLENLLTTTHKTIDGAINFVPSVPGDIYTVDNLEQINLFYCGVNWESIGNKKGRHHDLFMMLDKHDFMCFYGPNKFLGGHRPWKAFKSYRGEIPFDGTSIIKIINECRVSLVLSSDAHRESHAATNRLYESLAAGAIIISDDNKFVLDNFSDSILFIKHHENHAVMYHDILEKINWIKNNKEQALGMAKKAQEKYKTKFRLEKVLDNLLNKHEQRKNFVNNSLEKNPANELVTVIITLTNDDFELFKKTIESIRTQTYINYELIIILHEKYYDEVEEYFKKYPISSSIYIHKIDSDLISINKSIDINIPRGRLLAKSLSYVNGKYVIMMLSGVEWFSDYLSKSIKLFETGVDAVYSGWLVENNNSLLRERKMVFCDNVEDNKILSFIHRPREGTIIVRKELLLNTKSTLWWLDDFTESFMLVKALCNNGFEFSKTANVCVNEAVDSLIDHNLQVSIIKDAFLFNKKYNAIIYNIQETVLTSNQFEMEIPQEIFVKSYKEMWWRVFSNYPSFQRFAQRVFNFFKKKVK